MPYQIAVKDLVPGDILAPAYSDRHEVVESIGPASGPLDNHNLLRVTYRKATGEQGWYETYMGRMVFVVKPVEGYQRPIYNNLLSNLAYMFGMRYVPMER